MTNHTITLADPVVAYIDDRLADGSYASLSDYLSELIVQDMARRANATHELRDLLNDAEESGLSPRSLDEILTAARSVGRDPESKV
jgi:Arc/MetJ-type ribon-helix-helix transcriptional regulator